MSVPGPFPILMIAIIALMLILGLLALSGTISNSVFLVGFIPIPFILISKSARGVLLLASVLVLVLLVLFLLV